MDKTTKTDWARIDEMTEDAINAGIAADPDNPEVTDAMFARATSVEDSNLPESFKVAVRGMQKTPKKVATSIRLSPDVVAYFRKSGSGWQTRLDNVLKDYVAHH